MTNEIDTARVALRRHRRLQADLARKTKERDRLRALSVEIASQTDFLGNPASLANAMPLARRFPSALATITQRYAFMLSQIGVPPTPSIPHSRPVVLRYNTLPRAARMALAAPFLNIRVGDAFPRLDLARSDPDRCLVYVVTGGMCDPTPWRAHMPALSEWFEGRDSAYLWELTDATVDTVTLTRRSPLPRAVAFAPTMLRPGHLYCGIDTTSRLPVHVPFADISSGTLINGVAGSGKSTAVHVLLASVLANAHLFEHLYFLDGKDGTELARYQGHPKITVIVDEAEAWDLLPKLVATMRERSVAQRTQPGLYRDKGFIGVVIEEMSTFEQKPFLKDQVAKHTEFLGRLHELVRKGRSAGFKLWVTTQEPGQCPVAIRSNLQTVIAFRTPIDQHATMMFGQLDPTNDPRQLKTGFAHIRDGQRNTIRTVKFPVMPLPGGRS